MIRTALEGWVVTVTGLPTSWRHRPAARSFSDAHAVLDITGRRSKGLRDDLVYDDLGAVGAEIRYSTAGHRVFTFGVQIRSMRTADDLDALYYTSLIRDSLRLPQISTAVFAAANIAVNRVLSEIEIEETQDGRSRSVAQIDIAFNATAAVDDTPTTYISTATDATLETPEGTPVWSGDLEV